MMRFRKKILLLGGLTLLGLLAWDSRLLGQTSVSPTSSAEMNRRTVIEYAPIQYVAPTDGAKMYAQYCASCHGDAGRGNGPAAAALTAPPTDLTILTIANNGKFPEHRLQKVLSQVGEWAPHESAGMPYWYAAFRTLDNRSYSHANTRVNSLVAYIHTLQATIPRDVATAKAGQ